jgi:hypothetical protein
MICFYENSRPCERINLETLSADLEQYLDPVEAVEKKKLSKTTRSEW